MISHPPPRFSSLHRQVQFCAVPFSLVCEKLPPAPWVGLRHVGKVHRSLMAAPKRSGEQRLMQTWLLVNSTTSKPTSSAMAGPCRGCQ